MTTLRKLFAALVLVFALVSATAISALAETTYTVKPGDTLWQLSGDYLADPYKWGELVGKNPFLREPGRQFEHSDGRLIVLIKPGERLVGISNPRIAPPLPVSLSELGLATPVAPQLIDGKSFWQEYFPFLAVLLAALLGYGLYRFLMMLRDPGTSGEPIVRNGIPMSDGHDAIARRMQEVANRGYIATGGNISTDSYPTRVGPITHGTLNGWGRVQYRDNHIEMRRLNQARAYRARFQFPDGRPEEDLYFLEVCGNDVTRGTRYTGFTFAATQNVPVPAPPVPVEEPAAVTPPLRMVPTPPLVYTTVVVEGRAYSVPVGSTVTLTAEGEICISAPSACDIRVRTLKSAKRVKASKPHAVVSKPAAAADSKGSE